MLFEVCCCLLVCCVFVDRLLFVVIYMLFVARCLLLLFVVRCLLYISWCCVLVGRFVG